MKLEEVLRGLAKELDDVVRSRGIARGHFNAPRLRRAADALEAARELPHRTVENPEGIDWPPLCAWCFQHEYTGHTPDCPWSRLQDLLGDL